MDTQFMAPRSGRMIKEDGTIINIADILAGDADYPGRRCGFCGESPY